MRPFEVRDGGVLLTLNPAIYPERVVFDASGPFMDDFFMDIRRAGGRFLVKIRPKERFTAGELEALACSFFDSLVCELCRGRAPAP